MTGARKQRVEPTIDCHYLAKRLERDKREKRTRGCSLTVRQLPRYLQSRSDALSMKSYIRADRKCKARPRARDGDVIYGDTYIFSLSSERHAGERMRISLFTFARQRANSRGCARSSFLSSTTVVNSSSNRFFFAILKIGKCTGILEALGEKIIPRERE